MFFLIGRNWKSISWRVATLNSYGYEPNCNSNITKYLNEKYSKDLNSIITIPNSIFYDPTILSIEISLNLTNYLNFMDFNLITITVNYGTGLFPKVCKIIVI